MKIEANIAINPKNWETKDEYIYFDEALFKHRTTSERANALMESFKALIIRFETKALYWFMLLLIPCSVFFIRKIKKKEKL